ncbi:MAG: hypothetical protein Fur0037_28760 [Planctomycetota bacterium]
MQWSSTDRRSTGPESPGWFRNADGFGQEPLPGFEEVLAPAGKDGAREYLVCHVRGPGAIVRGWSAGMGGVLRVWLDDSDEPLFEGKGYDFFARRSSALVPGFDRLSPGVRAWFQQEDADYLPIPFRRSLRVVWRGRLAELHFYHLQVRRYAPGTAVETFRPQEIPASFAKGAVLADARAQQFADEFALDPGASWRREVRSERGARITRLSFRIRAPDLRAAYRGLLLRISFDGSERPQVETPLGDFSGAGVGMPAQRSAAFSSTDVSGFECLWPMPYAKTARIELENHSAARVDGIVEHRHEDHLFTATSLHFHAKWRIDRDLAADPKKPFDLPYLHAIGRGRLVGVACQLLNPPMDPRWTSNWWGQGDEKIHVDGALVALGTGCEDYFDYSWSHWRLFSFPYCQQPLASGPGNCGYVSNQRLQILDDLPFRESLAVAFEVWTHRPVRPLCQSRIVYWYARPGCVDDHPPIQEADLEVPRLAPWPGGVFSKEGETTCARLLDLSPSAARSSLAKEPSDLTRSRELLVWTAERGGELSFRVRAHDSGTYRLVLVHGTGEPFSFRARIDGKAIGLAEPAGAGGPRGVVRVDPGPDRLAATAFAEVDLGAGEHEVSLVAEAPGRLLADIARLEQRPRPARRLEGAVEAELWDLLASSEGVEVEPQAIGAVASSGYQRWIRARKVSDFAEFRLAAPSPGRYRVVLRLVKSWDYGVLRVDWNGETIRRGLDSFCGLPKGIRVEEVDLGERDLSRPARLRFTLEAENPAADPPRTYFGIDCVVLRKAEGR